MSERTVGWWEVTIENEGPIRAIWWDGFNWFWRKSELFMVSNQDSIFPIRLIEAANPITPAPGKWVLDNGEVVTLCESSMVVCIKNNFPCFFLMGGVSFYVTSTGDCIRHDQTLPFARLSHPYVEKTPVERLRELKQRVGNPVHEEIDGIIAELEKA